jgi:recombination protein RecT
MAGASIQKAVEQKAEARNGVATLRDAIKSSETQFAMALPSHVKPDRFLRAALTALNTVPKLAECTQHSVLAGLMQAAQLGLEVADVRGQAYLIPRWNSRMGCNEATFQLGYRGMIDLAARSGITVDVDEICANDAYDFQRGTKPYLMHKPTLGDRGDTLAYYAVATFSDGRPPSFVIMGKAEVEKHRDQFASSKRKDGGIYGPWVDHFDAMARKTVIRSLLNYLPVSVELREAAAIDTTGSDPAPQVVASYMAPITPALPPENVDVATGEITDDYLDAIDAASSELPLLD